METCPECGAPLARKSFGETVYDGTIDYTLIFCTNERCSYQRKE